MKQAVLFAALICLFSASAYAQKNLCDLPDIGTMEPNQLKVEASILHVYQSAWGGENTHNANGINGMYDLDLYYLLFADETENHKGDYTLLYFSSQASFDESISERIGSIFNLNESAKGNNTPFIDKLFVENTFWERALTVDIGKIDLVDFFDTSAAANCEKRQFLASPFVNNSAIPFPQKGLGTRVMFSPSDFWYAEAAIADAQANKRTAGFDTTFGSDSDLFTIGEIGIRPKFFNMPGTYRVMGWYDPKEGDETTSVDDGVAISFDQKLTDKFTGFVRYGWTANSVNEFDDFVSFGGSFERLFEGRDNDVLGIAYCMGVRNPNDLTNEDVRQINLAEAYYNIQISKNVHITPDIQLVMNPGGLENESPAVVFGLRGRITF
jgi:carbohydrate-selective porin OprB